MKRLRAHHIFCSPYISAEYPERSEEFSKIKKSIRDALLNRPETEVTVIEGVDELCAFCVHNVNGRCAHPKGDETQVRKWDAILLKALGVTFETCKTAGEWRELLAQKTPFKLCPHCKSREKCSTGIKAI